LTVLFQSTLNVQIEALTQSLNKTSSSKIKKQLQQTIEFGKLYLQEGSLKESILKDWRLKKTHSNDHGRKNDSNSRSNNSVRNLDDAYRGLSPNNRFQHQSSQVDQDYGRGYQQNSFQSKQVDQYSGGSYQQNRLQSRHIDQHNLNDYEQNRFHATQAGHQDHSGYQQNRFETAHEYQDLSNSFQQNRFQSRQVDRQDGGSDQQNRFQRNRGNQQYDNQQDRQQKRYQHNESRSI
jgi:hypothetical protein